MLLLHAPMITVFGNAARVSISYQDNLPEDHACRLGKVNEGFCSLELNTASCRRNLSLTILCIASGYMGYLLLRVYSDLE